MNSGSTTNGRLAGPSHPPVGSHPAARSHVYSASGLHWPASSGGLLVRRAQVPRYMSCTFCATSFSAGLANGSGGSSHCSTLQATRLQVRRRPQLQAAPSVIRDPPLDYLPSPPPPFRHLAASLRFSSRAGHA